MEAFDLIALQIRKYQESGLKLFTGSSFQTHSTVLLHIISRIDKTIPVYFLNTGFHFPETMVYKNEISNRFGLTTIDVKSSIPKNMQVDDNGRFLFTSDPDYCCYINKIQPLEPALNTFDVWINGVRADQNANRANFKVEEKTNHKAFRYHPMLNWTNKMIYAYINEYKIPRHPLDEKGYISIGCEPCTRKISMEMLTDERQARWYGMNKTECGLHTELIKQ